MRKWLTGLLVGSWVLLATGCLIGGRANTVSESFEQTVPLLADGSFEIENVNGSVHVETWERPEVYIQAEKSAPSEEALAGIEIRIRAEDDRVRVETHLSKGLWSFLGSSRGSVSYRLVVPETVRVDAVTVNGKVEVEDLAGALRAKSVNGSLAVSQAGGDVDASTVNGAIDVRYQTLPASGRHKYSTVNGAIAVHLPASASGDFSIKTVNGGISTDFPLDVAKKKRPGPKHVESRLGEGGGRFDFNTVNGSVRIVKQADEV